jgi:hypothetical protein
LPVLLAQQLAPRARSRHRPLHVAGDARQAAEPLPIVAGRRLPPRRRVDIGRLSPRVLAPEDACLVGLALRAIAEMRP